MAETAAEGENPKTTEGRESSATMNRTDVVDTIVSGNGFPLGSWDSQATMCRPQDKGSLCFLMESTHSSSTHLPAHANYSSITINDNHVNSNRIKSNHINGNHISSNHINSNHINSNVERRGTKVQSLQDKLLADNTDLNAHLHHQALNPDITHRINNLHHHQALNPNKASAKPQQRPPSFGNLGQKKRCRTTSRDGASTTHTRRIGGVRGSGMILEDTEMIAPEVIGEAVKQPATLLNWDRDKDDAGHDDEKKEKGGGLWDRSTVLVLVMFVGLRLMFEAWSGDLDVFLNRFDDGDP